MQNLTPLAFALVFSAIQFVNAQCVLPDESNFITSQETLNSLEGCEVFQGDLNITGSDISNLDALSSLVSIEGNLRVYETSVSTIDPLGGLMNANEISIYNNEYLSACCASLEWQTALDLGAISSITFGSNSTNCNSYSEAQAACLGLVPGCTDPDASNYNSQATLEDGSCLNGPDLQVSVNTILNSLQINSFTSSDECLVAEGCITGTGERKTLRFTTTISNYGNEDFYIGQSGGAGNLNPNFYWDDCHGHAHYEGYANYRLYNYPSLEPSETIGHKNGWCVMDLGAAVSSETPDYITNPSPCSFTYGCSTMGISKGCSDTYGSGISCQWVDITDLEDGEYVLAVSTNMETENYVPQYEINFENNIVYVLFELETIDNQTNVVYASEFDGSAISDICSPSAEATNLGFNFSEEVDFVENEALMPTAFLNEYFVESMQFLLTETYNLNGLVVDVDSLAINDISGLPLGVNWACEPQSCSFPVGNSCIGLSGIPSVSGSFDASISSTIYFTDSDGTNHEVTLPYNGGNAWLDSLTGGDNSVFGHFSPSIYINVEIPIYGCMDTLAYNFSPTATFDDGSCELPNLGCTDILSLNFDPDANFEDGSCEYCAEGIEWVVRIDLFDSYGDGWNDNNYVITNEQGDVSAEGTLANGSQGSDLFCLSPGCYMVNVPATGGWPEEISWEITAPGYTDVFVSGGCPDIQPLNFLSTECIPAPGCIDSLALNYDEEANFDNGSCIYPVMGCTDTLALNYDEDSQQNDGSCEYPLDCSGLISITIDMFDSYGDGWNGNYLIINGEEFTLQAGSGGFESACYDPDLGCVDVSCGGGSWQEEVSWTISDQDGNEMLSGGAPYSGLLGEDCNTDLGCTDELANNYNPNATEDDSSCTYDVVICNSENDCSCDNGSILRLSVLTPPFWASQVSWEILDNQDDIVLSIAPNEYSNMQNTEFEYFMCFPYSCDTYSFSSNGNSNHNATFYFTEVINNEFENEFETISNSSNSSFNFNLPSMICGCTDTIAENYDLNATIDDGSCEYPLTGCTDSLALNYDDTADIDDGSCDYPLECAEGTNMVLMELQTDPYPEETSWNLITVEGDTLAVFDGFEEGNTLYSDSVCVPDDIDITFNIYDTYGDGLTSGAGNGQFNLYVCGAQVFSGSSFEYLLSGTFSGCDGAQIIVFGCMDETAINYSPDANTDDGSCEYEVVLGCTDLGAVNYNEAATDDDGSCAYITCEFYEVLVEVQLSSINGNGWESLTYELSSFDGSMQESGTLETGFNGVNYYCLSSDCYLFTVPEYGGSESLNWSIIIEGKKQISGSSGIKANFGVNQKCELVMGCTDPNALNFNPLANVSDESCNYPNGGSQLLSLVAGWNLVSSYIQTENMSMEAIMASIIDDVIIVKNNLGIAYLPEFGFNGIGSWDNTQGYQTKLNNAAVIDMTGVIIEPEQTPISLVAGWNTIAYLRLEPAPVDIVLDAFTSDIIIVKDVLGIAYLPEWGFNGIGNMNAGQGYQIKLFASHELTYIANDDTYRTTLIPPVDNKSTFVEFDKNTGSNMHLLVPESAWNISVSSKDELYVYDAKGDMVGAAKITFPTTLITLWGNDLLTEEKDGLYNAEEWSVVLYSEKSNKLQPVSLDLKTGAPGFEKDALVIASHISESDHEKGLALYNSVPNPASNFTEISFYLNKEMDLTLRLFNVIGEEIKLITSGTKSAGYHTAQVDVNQLAPGSYFYQLQADDAQITKRLEVIK